MWKTIGIIVLVVLALALVIQILPIGRNHTNPPVVQEPQWDSPQTRELAMRACGDCHSNESQWPWYSNVAPVSWLVAHDVEEGRSKLNFSEWNRPQDEADRAAALANRGEMPPGYYAMMHKSAQLTAAEKDALVQGLLATFGGDLNARGEGGERKKDGD